MANLGERVVSPPSGNPGEAGTGRRGLVWVGAGVLLLATSWTLAGFTLVPWIAKRELPRIIAEQTQHRARIGEVRFNPFTLTLEATGFAVEDPAGQPLLGF